MSPKPVVVFDMDGVCADFVRGFTNLLCNIQGQDLSGSYGTGAQLSWDFDVEKHVLDEAWDRVRASTTFWTTLDTLLTPAETNDLRHFARDYDVRYMTARIGSTAREQTEKWLHHHGMLWGPVIISPPSKLALCNALAPYAILDDKPSVITELLVGGHMCYTRDWPYNRGIQGPRVSSLTEFFTRVARQPTQWPALTAELVHGTME